MTPQEAIKAMKFNKENLYNGISNQFISAFDVAVSALEKQIPKKPVESIHKYIDSVTKKHGGYRLTHCPRCWDNKQLGYFSTLVDKYTLYCHRCGQALDWSDTE